MGELLRQSWPFVLPGLLPVLALLHLPLAGRRARVVWAALLGAIAVLFVGDVLVLPHGETHTLEIKTVFGNEADGVIVVDRVTAPAWHWHIAVAAWFALTAAWAWSVRNRPAHVPRPVPIVVAAFAWTLAARLVLEKTAAPAPVVWGVGVTWTLFVIIPFFGWYCGARGFGFGRFALAWLLANVLQRLVLVAVGWVVTTRALGTHLDTHAIPSITLPGVGVLEPHDATEAWLYTLLLPQLTFALLTSFVIGLLLGALPWHLARRRAASATTTAA